MRQTLTGMVAAIGLMTVGAAPAMACGWGGCCGTYAPCAQTYVPAYTYAPAYAYSYSGCGTCGGWGYYGGWGYEHLAAPSTQYYPNYPITQYYYVNQGPTYTGPGAFAPYPTYEEGALPVYHYRWHHRYHAHHYAYHFGRYYQGHRVLRRYY